MSHKTPSAFLNELASRMRTSINEKIIFTHKEIYPIADILEEAAAIVKEYERLVVKLSKRRGENEQDP